MQNTDFTKEKKLSATIIVPNGDRNKGIKYSYVNNCPHRGVSSFIEFAKKKFPAALYINFYSRVTGKYLDRFTLK